jgi:hypothetical protein
MGSGDHDDCVGGDVITRVTVEGDHCLAGVLYAAMGVDRPAGEHERRGNRGAGVQKEERKPLCAQCHSCSRCCDTSRGWSSAGAGRTSEAGEEEQRGREWLGSSASGPRERERERERERLGTRVGRVGRLGQKGRSGRPVIQLCFSFF